MFRRVDVFRFELSFPVGKDAVSPSLWQCFLAFCYLASNDPDYMELDGFNSLLVSSLELYVSDAFTISCSGHWVY